MSNDLLRRYLIGPQYHYDQTLARIDDLYTMVDPTTIDNDLLKYLKDIVGFTSELNFVTKNLTEAQLRRLISGAVALWKTKGVTYNTAVRLVTGNRFYILNYFDYRFILDEVSLGEELGAGDPVMISEHGTFFALRTDGQTTAGAGEFSTPVAGTFAPTNVGDKLEIREGPDVGVYEIIGIDPSGTTAQLNQAMTSSSVGFDLDWIMMRPMDEFLTELRIMDTGDIDRAYLESVLELVRPMSERINVVYVDFLDAFDVDNETSLWTTGQSLVVVDNEMTIPTTKRATPITSTLSSIYDYLLTVRAKMTSNVAGDECRIQFHYQNSSNCYEITWKPQSDSIVLKKRVAGTPTTLATGSAFDFSEGVYYTFRINVNKGASTTSITVDVDGNRLIEFSGANLSFTSGSFSILANGADVVTDYVELVELPGTVVRVGPNP